jgi:hypothetical protein
VRSLVHRGWWWGLGLLLGGGLFAACAGAPSRPASPPANTTMPDSTRRDTVRRPPPPHTAHVRGTVTKCTEAPRRCTIQVERVAAYGVNTPPIAPGPRPVRLRETGLDDRTLDALVAGGPWRMTLVHAGPRLRAPREASTEPAWTLTRVTPIP